MKVAITGKCRLCSKDIGRVLNEIQPRIRPIRFVHDLERISIAAAGSALIDAKINFPAGDSGIGIYLGVDDAVEDIKDEYFNRIVKDGILGASPLLFPFTTPNALTAQISIAFDIRGENITMPVKDSCADVIKYAAECIVNGYTSTAVAGGIYKSLHGGYCADIFFLEETENALKRAVGIHSRISDTTNENSRLY